MSDKEVIIIDVKVTVESIEKKTYMCEECSKAFNSDQSLKKHILISHHQIQISKEKSSKISYRFNCPIANCRRSLKIDKEYFTSRKHLYQHFYKVHNSGKFSCTNQDCGKKFSTEMLRNIHTKNCGKTFTCHCNCCFNSKEALQTHQKRKHPTIHQKEKVTKKKLAEASTRSVSTTTSGLGWSSTDNLSFPGMSNTTSVFTSTDQPISSTKSTETVAPTVKVINSSTSTDDKEENSNSLSSSSSHNKKNINWSGDFDDSINNLFDSDVKMEFYSAETQTDLNENLLNNNYTQTTFSDLYDFEKFDKFDIQTQTNWDE